MEVNPTKKNYRHYIYFLFGQRFSMLGSFGYDQLVWLDRVLAEGKPTFVFFHQPLFLPWPQHDVHARTVRLSAGQQSESGGCAGRLGIGRKELHAITGQLVEIRRWSPYDLAATIRAEHAPADVIG